MPYQKTMSYLVLQSNSISENDVLYSPTLQCHIRKQSFKSYVIHICSSALEIMSKTFLYFYTLVNNVLTCLTLLMFCYDTEDAKHSNIRSLLAFMWCVQNIYVALFVCNISFELSSGLRNIDLVKK